MNGPMARQFLQIGLALGIAAVAAGPAQAQQSKKAAPQTASATSPVGGQSFLLGTFGDWKALMSGKDKSKLCYVLAQPKDRKPAGLKRDPAFLFITTRLSDGTKNEIAVKLGFVGKDGSLSIGSTSFPLLASAESAFLKNPAQEAQLIEAMKKAGDLTVKVASIRGNETTDKYSLNGFGKALERMAKECP